jgi:hypothetical protein
MADHPPAEGTAIVLRVLHVEPCAVCICPSGGFSCCCLTRPCVCLPGGECGLCCVMRRVVDSAPLAWTLQLLPS